MIPCHGVDAELHVICPSAATDFLQSNASAGAVEMPSFSIRARAAGAVGYYQAYRLEWSGVMVPFNCLGLIIINGINL